MATAMPARDACEYLVNTPEIGVLSAVAAQMTVCFRAVCAITRGRVQARSALMRPTTRRQ